MSDLEKTDQKTESCIPDTQETYYEGANEASKERVINETQSLGFIESQDFHLFCEGDESVTDKAELTEDEKNNRQVEQSESQTLDASLQLQTDDKEDEVQDKELLKEEKDVPSNVLDPEEKTESPSEDNQEVPSPSSLLSLEMATSNVEVANLKRKVESSDEQSAEVSRPTSEDNVIAEEKDAETQELLQKPGEETEEAVSSNVRDSETKNEFSDEDEVIQGTPPSNYSSTKLIGSVDVASLKRKGGSFEELPAKVSKLMSIEDTTSSKKFEDEESHQSCESNDSYQDLFTNPEKNVIIEETQDATNQELTQDSSRCPLKHANNDDKAEVEEERCLEQTNEEEGNGFSTKYCDVEKDENLNVSAKLSDTSADDSTTVNMNSMNESHLHVEDNNISEAKEDVSTTSVTAIDEGPKTKIPDETDKAVEVKDLDITSDKEKTEETKDIESTEEIKDNERTSVAQIKAPVGTPLRSLKPRFSVELIYDTGCGNKSKQPEVVEIDDDGEKIVLDSSSEMIYDSKNNLRPEIIEIVDDSREDGDRIILATSKLGEGLEINKNESLCKSTSHDSKATSDFSYKSVESMKESSLDSKSTADNKLVNGTSDSKNNDTDATLNVESDTFSVGSVSCDTPIHPAKGDTNSAEFNRKLTRNVFLGPKDLDNNEVISISDNDISNVEEKNKSDLVHNSTLAKGAQIERDFDVYLKFKCTLHVDESTKEFLNKEVTMVQCETVPPIESVSISKQKNEDSQASLADISDNKESPGSVNSNPQLFHLNPSRLSIMSSVSSSSSASSAASLAAKLNLRNHFTMPVGPAKHAKKHSPDVSSTINNKQTLDETYEHLTREWKNHRLIVTSILNCINAELSSGAGVNAAVPMDAYVNVSNERLDDHHHHRHSLSEKSNMRSSTPEVPLSSFELINTPKSTNKNKGTKRPRSKSTKSTAQSSSESSSKNTLDVNAPILHAVSKVDTDVGMSPSRKKLKVESSSSNTPVNDADLSTSSLPQNAPMDDMIGKNVFAKWSDNSYYPGTVGDRVKAKYKINFFDGKSKMLIPDFVIQIPKILKEGLSVYAINQTTGYGSCGIIIDVQANPNDENVYYIVETDEGERLRVQVQDLFLSADQAQVLKEDFNSEGKGSVPSTPKSLGQVTLDNMVEGTRRSKRIGTPVFSTPKSRSNTGASGSTSKLKAEPSVSGMSDKKPKKERSAFSDVESVSSDSNAETAIFRSEDKFFVLRGVQKEIIGTPYQQIVKGPQSRIKGKPRSKKRDKMEDERTIETLGPIPSTNSNIFKGMSFLLTCVALEDLDRYQSSKPIALSALSSAASSVETEATETETDNEDDWTERPFVRERLYTQIETAGGKVYESFDQIPKEEYKNTTLITNVPNTTVKSILCLSVGISACNHKWIIRCCSEDKIVNMAEEVLPTGWSLQKRSYVEAFQATGNKPLSNIVVIIPTLIYDKGFSTFWQKVCENAGAVVLIAENSESMELMDFDSDVIVISNRKCPSWAVERALQLGIPVLSTTWVTQCLIESKRCPYDQHPRYKYNYTD